VRLFSALVPSADAVRSLRAALDGISETDQGSLSWTTPRQWHVTLGYYGVDDPVARTARLRTALAGLPPRPVCLRGAGTFPGVLWIGVDGDLDGLAAATAADGDERPFRPHLTIGRRRDRTRPDSWARALGDYRGPGWTAGEVVLFASEPGPRYLPVERFTLGADTG
jgi:2'-5' RNA ligase